MSNGHASSIFAVMMGTFAGGIACDQCAKYSMTGWAFSLTVIAIFLIATIVAGVLAHFYQHLWIKTDD